MPQLVGVLVLFALALALLLVVLAAVLVRGCRRPPPRTAAYAVARGLACDPAEAGFEFDSWTLDRSGGARLPVWEIAGDARNGPGPGAELTVVVVHGWGQSRIDMLARARELRERSRRVVLYDLRGHGEAEGAVSDLGHREDDDLRALLVRLGRGPFLLVGHSMGAVIAIHAAAGAEHEGLDVVGVIASGPYLDFHASLRARLRLAGYPARPLTDLAMIWLRLVGLRHRPLLDAAERVRCPLLVVSGTHDAVAPPADAARLAEAAPSGELLRVEGAEHLDLSIGEQDVRGRRLGEAIGRFMDRLRT